jgi:hypothetical protein
MRKALILVLLGAGTLAGYAHAFHSYRHRGCFDGHGAGRGFSAPWAMHDEERTRDLANACVNAAREVQPAAPATTTLQ